MIIINIYHREHSTRVDTGVVEQLKVNFTLGGIPPYARQSPRDIVATHNNFHNILRPFNALLNFPFTTSETVRDHYLQTRNILVVSRVAKRLKT